MASNVIPISSVAPRAPIVMNEKSGTLDRPDNYRESVRAWRAAAREEAIQTLKLNPERDYIRNYCDMLEGRYYGRNRPKYRSQYFDNRLAEARLAALCALTDIRPSMEVSCLSDIPEYTHQAEIHRKCIQAVWDMEDLDLRTEAVVDHALLTAGYWKIGATMPTEIMPARMLVLPCGIDMVLPIQPGFDFQDSSAVLYRVFKPLHRVKQAFGQTADGLEREISGSFLSFVGGSYPDSLIPDYCFAPHALVQDSCGRISPISLFNESRFALDSNGKPTKAKVVLSSRKNESTVELKTWGTFGSLPTTVEHKVLTPNGFVEAQSVQVGDYVRRPVRKIQEKQKTITLIEQGSANAKGTGDGIGKGHRPIKMKVNFDVGWLFGFYLAEGTIRYNGNGKKWPGGLAFGIHQDEEPEFTASLQRALGVHTHIHCYRHEGTKGGVLLVGQASLGRFVVENFGGGDDKHIPDWAWDCGEDFCRGIVCGYIEGDGHLRPKDNAVIAKSIRPAITLGIRELMLSLGLGWAKVDYVQGGEVSGRNCQPSYVLRTNGLVGLNLRKAMGWPHYPLNANWKTREIEKSWKYSECGRFLDVVVEEKTTGFSETFYDLAVESKCHDFLTIHGIAHNSYNSQNPAIRQQPAGRSGIAMASEAGPFASVEVEEYWIDDPSVNESFGDIQVKDPRLKLEQHNYHYRVPRGQRLFPRKRLMVWAGDHLLYDGPAPYWHGLYPFAQLILRPAVWRAGGMSAYRNLTPLQLAGNKVGAGVLDLVERAVDPQMAFSDGAVDDTSFRNYSPDRPGAILKMNPNAQWGQHARYVDPPPLPAYVANFQDRLDRTFDRQSGALDSAGMMRKNQVPGGDTIEAFRDSAQTIFRLDSRHIEPFMRAAGMQFVSHFLQFWSRRQRMWMLGKDGATWQDFMYEPNMIPLGEAKEDYWRRFPVRIAAGSMHGGKKDRDKQIALTLYKINAIDRETLLEILDFPDIPKVLQRVAEQTPVMPPEGVGKGASPRLTRGARVGNPY